MSADRHVDYLLVGGGVAAAQAAVGIREIDAQGTVEIVTEEPRLPYDRPPLSKGILFGKMTAEDAESKDPSFYPGNSVAVTTGNRVAALDLDGQTATLANGDRVAWGRLLLATGARPRRPAIPGLDLPGVHLFRRVEDALAVGNDLKSAKSAVMVGAGYIGLEVAAACLGANVPVCVVESADRPWPRVTSPRSGGYLRKFFEHHGAQMICDDAVVEILGDSRVEGVRLQSGAVLPADMVVVGVGIDLNLDLAKAAGLPTKPGDGVEVDEKLKVAGRNVYVAGDIACFPDATTGKRWHGENYLNAKWQGRQAGRNMAGADEPFARVPYLFSDFLDLHFILRGDPGERHATKIVGDVDAGEFVELFAGEDGTLATGIAFSHSEPRLDAISDRLEAMILEKRKAGDVTEADFGFDADKGLG